MALSLVARLMAQAPTSRTMFFNSVQTTLPPSGTQDLVVQLWDDPTTGNLLFSETQPAVGDDANSTVSFVFGSQTVGGLDPTLFPSASSRYVDVTDTNGVSVLAGGRLLLTASPFALNPGPQGPVGPQGLQGPQGPQGPPAPVANFSRIGFVPVSSQFTDDGSATRDVALLTITPGGTSGATAFIKIDASFSPVVYGQYVDFARFWISRDSDNSTSMTVNMPGPVTQSAGAITWAVSATAGVPETFRLKFNYPSQYPGCLPSSCFRFNVTGAITAITAPFGASGGSTLQ